MYSLCTHGTPLNFTFPSKEGLGVLCPFACERKRLRQEGRLLPSVLPVSTSLGGWTSLTLTLHLAMALTLGLQQACPSRLDKCSKMGLAPLAAHWNPENLPGRGFATLFRDERPHGAETNQPLGFPGPAHLPATKQVHEDIQDHPAVDQPAANLSHGGEPSRAARSEQPQGPSEL